MKYKQLWPWSPEVTNLKSVMKLSSDPKVKKLNYQFNLRAMAFGLIIGLMTATIQALSRIFVDMKSWDFGVLLLYSMAPLPLVLIIAFAVRGKILFWGIDRDLAEDVLNKALEDNGFRFKISLLNGWYRKIE